MGMNIIRLVKFPYWPRKWKKNWTTKKRNECKKYISKLYTRHDYQNDMIVHYRLRFKIRYSITIFIFCMSPNSVFIYLVLMPVYYLFLTNKWISISYKFKIIFHPRIWWYKSKCIGINSSCKLTNFLWSKILPYSFYSKRRCFLFPLFLIIFESVIDLFGVLLSSKPPSIPLLISVLSFKFNTHCIIAANFGQQYAYSFYFHWIGINSIS